MVSLQEVLRIIVCSEWLHLGMMWDPVRIFALQVLMSPSSLSSFLHNFCPGVFWGVGVYYVAFLFSCLLRFLVDLYDHCSQQQTINSSARGYRCHIAYLGGEGAGDTCSCATTACFPFGEKEGRRRKVPIECPVTQLVSVWKGDGWISCEAVCSWVMKWRFKTEENLKGWPGIEVAINSPSLI